MAEFIVSVMTWFLWTMICISVLFVIVCLFMAVDNFIKGRRDNKPGKHYV